MRFTTRLRRRLFASLLATAYPWTRAVAGTEAGPGGEDQAIEAGRVADTIEFTERTFDAWREHLAPRADETRWREISWLPTFFDGLIQADRQRKPLLLWVMNGHPLGCT